MNPQKLVDRPRYLAVGSLTTWNHNQVLYRRTELHSRLSAVYLKPQWQVLMLPNVVCLLGSFQLQKLQFNSEAIFRISCLTLPYRLPPHSPVTQKRVRSAIQRLTLLHMHIACDGPNTWPKGTYKDPGFAVVRQTCCPHSGLQPPAHEPHCCHCPCPPGALLILCDWVFPGLTLSHVDLHLVLIFVQTKITAQIESLFHLQPRCP